MNIKKAHIRQQAHDDYLKSIDHSDKKRPNIVLVFVDDMGYGDISCFGSTAINTPNIDRLAQNGVKLNNFYAASPVCTPSRFSCLTGRYPNRGYVKGVFFSSVTAKGRLVNRISFPYGIQGILPDEITVAEALRAGGYKTAAFGKWHLGDKSPSLPNDKGFEYFYGAHYSVDMDPYLFYRNLEPVSPEPADKTQLTKMLTQDMSDYIDENHDSPFFLYYASPYPHHPAHASKDFAGRSRGGTYGDCVEELDWSVGEIYKKLEQYGIEKDTLFIFTSDNGPWFEGNPGLHRGRKGLSFDGGQMVPFVACWPNEIPAGTEVDNTAMNIDFFPTFLDIAGVPMPKDREIDGLNILPLLKGEVKENLHDELCFICFEKLFGIRDRDNFKYTIRHKHDTQRYTMLKQGPFLFDLNHDQNESYDVSAHYPEKKEEMRKRLEEIQNEFDANPRGWK